MPTVETIQKGLPNEVQIIVKVPHWHIDQGRVYWQKKVPKELFTALVNLAEDGINDDDMEKAELQAEVRYRDTVIQDLDRKLSDMQDNEDKLKKKIKDLESKQKAFIDAVNKASKK